MRIQEQFRVEDVEAAREHVRRNGLATIVAPTLAATHMPCVAEDGDGLTLVSHVARPDPFSAHVTDGAQLLLVFTGPHGYVSASWYPTGELIPTWDYVALHVRGRVELVEARAVLERTVEHFEGRLPDPWRLEGKDDMVASVIGFRVRADDAYFEAKLHQDKAPEIRDAAVAGLEAAGPYRNPALARAIRAASAGRSR